MIIKEDQKLENILDKSHQNDEIVGIDFGTSNTTISHLQTSTHARILPDEMGQSLIPTIVAYDGSKFLFGRQCNQYPDKNLYVWKYLKRELGTKNKTYTIESKTEASFKITSEELITKFLEYINKLVASHIELKPYSVVISSPAYFDEDQKSMLQNCFTKAGFNVLQLLAEPTAACINYGHDNFFEDGDRFLIFDVGGGTTDIAVIEYKDSKYSPIPTSGNSNLGGKDFDEVLFDWVLEDLEHDLQQTREKWLTKKLERYIYEVVERAKKDLSKHEETTIVLANLIPKTDGSLLSWTKKLNRQTFLKLTKEIRAKADEPLARCLDRCELKPNAIKKVIMVGGASATYGFFDMIQDRFPSAQIISDSNSKYCVSKGNALFLGYIKEFNKSIITEKINKSIGVLAFDPNNASEPVAYRRVIHILHRGEEIPAFGSYTFRTSITNQKDAEIILVQGEGSTFGECNYIGTVTLDDIGIAKAGVNKITVSLKIDNRGLLTVYAEDSIKNVKKELKIKLDKSWTAEDYAKLVKSIQQADQLKEKEEFSRNYTKIVSWLNKQVELFKKIPKDNKMRRFIQRDLINIDKAIKAGQWDKVPALIREYKVSLTQLQFSISTD